MRCVVLSRISERPPRAVFLFQAGHFANVRYWSNSGHCVNCLVVTSRGKASRWKHRVSAARV